jgi:probable F420-dependent oxidoreductase
LASNKSLKFGLVYPQTEYGDNPAAIQEYARTAEGMGFTHILAYDHVLGANPERPGGWKGTYTFQHPFHDPLVLFGFMAGVTRTIEFVTGVIILPQRQTALFARQAASLDLLSGGRLRLGVGNGWNAVEYTALNENFHNRGKRIEEQVTLLRLLWTQPLVTFQGRWHTIPDAGLNPLPSQRPIPIWFGGNSPAVLERTARLGDGWMPNYRRVDDALPTLDLLDQYLQQAGRPRIRSKSSGSGPVFGIEARIPYGDGHPETWLTAVESWQSAGATHISFNTMGSNLGTPASHLAAVRKIAEALGLQSGQKE